MKLLFLADPITQLKPKGDSTLALLRCALHRGMHVYWATDRDLEVVGEDLRITATKVVHCEDGEVPLVCAPERNSIFSFDACFIRKDPPFDSKYVKLCWLLGLAEERVWMMNPPSLLLRFHEKLIPLEARLRGFLEADDLIPTHIGTRKSADQFVQEGRWPQIVAKPFFGHGGHDVTLISSSQVPKLPEEDLLVQPYQSEVTLTGDRRVFLLDGEVLAHFARIPKAGNFVSNLAQGGTAISSPVTARETAALKRLGRFLKETGIILAGADVIGGRISEVNVTSPTGLMSLIALEHHDYSEEILSFAERSVRQHRR